MKIKFDTETQNLNKMIIGTETVAFENVALGLKQIYLREIKK